MIKQKIRKFFKRRKGLGYTIIALFSVIMIFVCLSLSSGIPKVKGIDNYNGDNRFITFHERPLIAAHRAGADVAPENTLAAFESCLKAHNYRVDILEFDLHVTFDDKLVLLPDDSLDRTSNAREFFKKKNVLVSQKTYGRINGLNMAEKHKDKSGNYPYRGLRGQDIPNNIRIISLREILEYIRSEIDYDLYYIIEIKDEGELGNKAMDLLYKELVYFDIVDKVIVGTFNKSVSDYIDMKYPMITRSAGIAEVLEFYYCSIFNVDLSKKNIKYKVLQIPYKDFGINLGKKSIVDYAHHYGIAVQYWTINKEKHIKHLVEIGADAIITDSPDVAYKVIYR